MWLKIQEDAGRHYLLWCLCFLGSVAFQEAYAYQVVSIQSQVWSDILGFVFCSLHLMVGLGWFCYLLIGRPMYHKHATLSSWDIRAQCEHKLAYFGYTETVMWIDLTLDSLQWIFLPDMNDKAALFLFFTAVCRWKLVYLNRQIASATYFSWMYEQRFSISFLVEQQLRLVTQAIWTVVLLIGVSLTVMILTVSPIHSSSTPTFESLNVYGYFETQRTLWVGSWWGMFAILWVFTIEDYSCLDATPLSAIPPLAPLGAGEVPIRVHPWVIDFFDWVHQDAKQLFVPLQFTTSFYYTLEAPLLPFLWFQWSIRTVYTCALVLGFLVSTGSWLWMWLAADPSTPSYASYFTIIAIGSVVGSACSFFFLTYVALQRRAWTYQYIHLLNSMWLLLAFSWIPIQIVNTYAGWSPWEWAAWGLSCIALPFYWCCVFIYYMTMTGEEANPEWTHIRRPWLLQYHVTKFYKRFIQKEKSTDK